MKRALKELRPYMGYVVLSLIFALFSVIATLFVPIYIGEAVDCIVDKNQVDFNQLYFILKKMALMIVVGAIGQYLMGRCNNFICYGFTKDIRRQAFAKTLKLPLKKIDGASQGDYVSRIITDADALSDGLLLGFNQFFTGILTILGTIVFMMRINVGIALVVVALTPLSFFFAKFVASKTKTYFKAQAISRGDLTEHIREGITQMDLLKSFNYVDENAEEFIRQNDILNDNAFKATFYSSVTNPGTRFINSLIYAGVIVAGSFIALNGGITIGALTTFLGYAREYSKPFNEVTGVVTEMQNAVVCAKRLFDLIDSEEVVDDGTSEIKNPGHIEFKDVFFSYTKENPLIEHLNLEVLPGQRVAIVGPTGAGKTTFINLLMRFYETDQGGIFVDGVNIKDVSRGHLRSNFGMVLQETWLKEDTILNNLKMANPNATMDEIIEATKAAHAHSFIKKMPKGYDTLLQGEGDNLSQGQKQLLCIARLMLAHPPMLILDEATSSIDTRTEMKIQSAFGKIMEGRTTFIVAHRLSTILDADIILYMENGKVLEQGSHKELLKKQGRYAALYNSQFA
ncbi:MAG: ABC transporter ATP-binding protein/permease [Lachnospiraceae bacterium]|nr:ABC transporter ATP-binding protein/permease [Lachnospiraceae bacterium]